MGHTYLCVPPSVHSFVRSLWFHRLASPSVVWFSLVLLNGAALAYNTLNSIVKPGKLGKIPIKGKIRSRLSMDRVGLEGRSGAICSYFTLFFGGKLHSIESNLQGKPRRYGLIFKIMWKFVHNGWMEWERGERREGWGGFLVFGQGNKNEEKKGPVNSYQVSEKNGWMNADRRGLEFMDIRIVYAKNAHNCYGRGLW